jgi:hypothetical protein
VFPARLIQFQTPVCQNYRPKITQVFKGLNTVVTLRQNTKTTSGRPKYIQTAKGEGMYNRYMMEHAAEIRAEILAMPPNYVSPDYLTAFPQRNPDVYDDWIRMYMSRNHSRPHAIQIVNSQLMHTVNHCFSELTRKTSTEKNPKGGNMSRWIRY